MKRQELRTMLQKEIEAFHEIMIKRSKIDKNQIDCIPLEAGQDLVMVQYLYDFLIDGYKILRIKDITAIRSGNHERFSEKILRDEGILNQVKTPPVSVNNWGTVLRDILVLEKNIVVECEILGEFYIGRIVEVSKFTLSLLHFDPLGEWDDEPTQIAFKDISVVSFDDRYSSIMSKYAVEKSPKGE